MSEDLPVIFRAADIGEADIVVHWLAERDIKAIVLDRFAAGTLQVPQVVAPYGIEVSVIDPSQADAAREALAVHFNLLDSADSARSDAPVEARCDACGKSTTFPGPRRGKVERCAHCDAYIDVPE